MWTPWWSISGVSACEVGARLIPQLPWLAAVMLLVGCSAGDPAAELLADYRTRVERTLEGSAGPAPALELARWPRGRTRLHPLPRRRIDLLDFASLPDCGLAALVGERSSSLGRVTSARGVTAAPAR